MFAIQSALAGPAAALPSLPNPPSQAYWYQNWQMPKVWKINQGAGVTVAVIDSGFQTSNGDLHGQVLPGLDLSSDHSGTDHDIADPGSGGLGHGTFMATLIAGTGKGAGLIGIAPQAKILPIRLPQGNPSSAVAQGIQFAIAHHAQIINMSLGTPGACDPTILPAIRAAYQHDIIVVASTGDEGGTVDDIASCPGAIAAGGDDANFKPWKGGSTGPELDFVAPAFNLVTELLDNTITGAADGSHGTSGSAALISGTFALLRSTFPHDTAQQIVTRALYNTLAANKGGHNGKRISDELGYGEIQPYYALTRNPPANFPNPIYTGFAQQLGPATPSGASPGTGSSTKPTGPPTGITSTTQSAGPGTPTGSTPTASSSSASSGHGAVIGGIIIAVVVIAIIIAIVIVRSRRRPPPPPPGNHTGYGAPPPYRG